MNTNIAKCSDCSISPADTDSHIPSMCSDCGDWWAGDHALSHGQPVTGCPLCPQPTN